MLARLLALSAAAFAPLAAAQSPVNLGFEDKVDTTSGAGWLVVGGGEGPVPYWSERTRFEPFEGRSCLALERRTGDADRRWSYAYQYVDAAPYRGRRVRLGAAIRAEVSLPSELRLFLAAADAEHEWI